MAGTGIELRYTEGTSYKYHRTLVAGSTVIVNFGRIGSAGQVTVHHCENEAAASLKAFDLVNSKVRKGYRTYRGVSEFPYDPSLAAAAKSTTSHTGNGGTSAQAGRDMVNAWDQYDRAVRRTGKRDPRALVAAHPDNAIIKALICFDDHIDFDLLADLAGDDDVKVQKAASSRVMTATMSDLDGYF
jgi:predicted DNA-binding WGR domain protein